MKITDYVADGGDGQLVVPSANTAPVTVSFTNIDDIFRFMKSSDVKEVDVSFEDMYKIAMFVLTITSDPQLHEEYSKIFTEGEIKRFMGIKLNPIL